MKKCIDFGFAEQSKAPVLFYNQFLFFRNFSKLPIMPIFDSLVFMLHPFSIP